MSSKTSTRQQRRQHSRKQLRQSTSSARRPPTRPRGRRLGEVVRDAVTADAPAWNAVWAAVLVVPVAAWVLGAWLLPALDIRPRSSLHFDPNLPPDTLQPEPLEQQRYILAVLAALAIVPCARAIARRRSLDAVARFAPPVGLVCVVTVVMVCLVRDHRLADRYYSMGPVLALVVAAVLAFGTLTLFAGRCRWLVLTVDRVSRRRGVEALVLVAALLLALGVCLVGSYTDRSILTANDQTLGHIQFTFEEVTAVAYGRTPLVDFTPQYTALFSWLLAPFFLLRTPSIALFTTLMVAIGTLSLLCLYVTYRLVTGTAARAALLFLPTCAIGFVVVYRDSGWNIHSIANYFAAMPLRDAGPAALTLVAVWVAAAPRSARRAVLLGAAAAFTTLLNVDYGVPAAGAAVLAALALNADERPFVARSARLLAELTAGAAAVVVAFAAMTYARSGSLPEFSQLVYFQRQFAEAGFFMLPMDHLLALHAVVFATCAAATIAGFGLVAFGRVRLGIHGRRSAALLIYSGILGFGVFEYYVGRTHPDVLSATFLAWAVALMALCWETGCQLAAGGVSARAARPAAAVLLGGSVALGVIATRHLEYVVHQPARIVAGGHRFAIYLEPDAVNAARRCLPRGANALVVTTFPDRVASRAHIHNWYAYDHPASVVTDEQIARVFSVAARHRVTAAVTQGIARDLMAAHGFVPVRAFTSSAEVQQYQPAIQTTVWARLGVHGAVDCHGAGRVVPDVTS